ncbi:trans-sulfuration enzyme family protein [Aeromicrobium alkaliterrae]|uniref:Aminotransferase class I/II-fold pyridoxal phosphate-dependent enzyme n=1 Tax=Aeromicrobium alkaliterrae TaxID=302168 RepID=A0ABN2JRK9_9ACTN
MSVRPTSLETLAVAAGRPAHEPGGPLNTPITLATALVPGGASEYTRHGHPGWEAFEEAVGALEGGNAVSFGSGMAATVAVLELLPVGAKVVAADGSYYGTTVELERRARRGLIKLELVDVTDTEAVIAAAADAAMVWLESPTNPALDVADIRAICAAVTAVGTAVVVDNTLATPLRQRPLDLGADFVVHSASKLLSGHSDVLMGVVVTHDDRAARALATRRTSLGSVPGSLEAYLALRGLRTLHVRLDRAEDNATEIAARLLERTDVTGVRYPGFGTMVSFEVAGGAEAAQRATEASEVVVHATSLGGVESTWERRRRHAGEPANVPESLVRLSVGIENVEDVWEDIARSLDAVSTGAPAGGARREPQRTSGWV